MNKMEKLCVITKEMYDWRNLRKTESGHWVLSSLCREAGLWLMNGVPDTDEVKRYYILKNRLFALHQKTLILLSHLASTNKTSMMHEMKTMFQIEQEWSETTLKKDRLTITMEEHIDFMSTYIKDLKDLALSIGDNNSRNYEVYMSKLVKGRSYMDIFEQ